MKNLFDATVANQVKTRLGKLEPQSERRWGKMTAAQMLAHCSVSMQWAVGEVVPEKAAIPVRLMGRLVKPMVFRNEDPPFIPVRTQNPLAVFRLRSDPCDHPRNLRVRRCVSMTSFTIMQTITLQLP